MVVFKKCNYSFVLWICDYICRNYWVCIDYAKSELYVSILDICNLHNTLCGIYGNSRNFVFTNRKQYSSRLSNSFRILVTLSASNYIRE